MILHALLRIVFFFNLKMRLNLLRYEPSNKHIAYIACFVVMQNKHLI